MKNLRNINELNCLPPDNPRKKNFIYNEALYSENQRNIISKKKLLQAVVISFCALFWISSLSFIQAQKSAAGWKAGVARVNITPQESMWMAGYGSRDHPSEGTLHDLWAKALVLEDADGKRAVLITTDLAGMRKSYSDRLRDRLESKYRLSRAQVLINFSHTHSGPVVEVAPEDIPESAKESSSGQYSGQEQDKIKRYSMKLEEQIINLVGDALKNLGPAQLSGGNGVARFAVNRRTNTEATTRDGLTQLQGPVDHSVPVLKVTKPTGELVAVVFGYACHNTVLNIYKWSGDYAGFAQIELERSHPGATAMFFQGTGADQNPLPRRTVELAQQYGSTLAAAVQRVINEPMKELGPGLKTAYSEVPLSFRPAASEKAPGNDFPSTFPYPVQLWQIGGQNIVALGGEVVVDYAIRLKEILGKDLFVAGYSNTMMGYIPSVRVLREGGYEGERVHLYYGESNKPSVWRADIESKIITEVLKLAEQSGIAVP